MEDAAAAPYAAPKQITYENTYITEPEGYGEVRTHMCRLACEFPGHLVT